MCLDTQIMVSDLSNSLCSGFELFPSTVCLHLKNEFFQLHETNHVTYGFRIRRVHFFCFILFFLSFLIKILNFCQNHKTGMSFRAACKLFILLFCKNQRLREFYFEGLPLRSNKSLREVVTGGTSTV